MNSHATRNVPVKVVPVDIGIIPVVNWLNSFEYVITAYSCEGDEGPTPAQVPYVLFYCAHPADMIRITATIRGLGRIEVDFDEHAGGLRYYLQFHDAKARRQFIEEQNLR